MGDVDKLEKAVTALPTEEYRQFRRWFMEQDWEIWDRQIEADSQAGKLDILEREAREAKEKGRLKNL